MQLLSKLNSLDNVADGSTRKLLKTATSSGSGNAVTAVSISGDTLKYTKDKTFSVDGHTHTEYASKITLGGTAYNVSNNNVTITAANLATALGTTPVGRATADASGNDISKTYALTSHSHTNYASKITLGGTAYNVSSNNVTITGANLVSAIGNTAVARATADGSGNAIISSYASQLYIDGTKIGIRAKNGSSLGTVEIPGVGYNGYKTSLATAHSTYYLTGVTTEIASDNSDIFNTRLSSRYTGVKYVTSTSEEGGSLYVDDREVVTGLYYEIS